MSEKRVIVLGAGASIGHSEGRLPGIGDIFKSAKQHHITTAPSSEKILNSKYAVLSKYIAEHFGVSILDSSKAINIEEILTYIEIETERDSSGALVGIRRQLKELIREVLVSASQMLNDSEGDYDNFLKKLSADDTVITFNWDLLLDSFLKKELANNYMAIMHNAGNHRIQYRNFLDSFTVQKKYNLFTDGIEAEQRYRIHFPYTKWEGRSVYLKLHGSIDWFSCSNSGCRAHGELFVVEDPMKEYFCSDCYEQLYNVLIPPVLNKQLREFPIIRKIWNTALHEMREAKHLVIWGYSLPPTDFYSSWLLRQARTNITTLTLIDPSVVSKTVRLNNSYINRFAELFRKTIPKTDIRLFESMSDYVDSQDVYSKYSSLMKS